MATRRAQTWHPAVVMIRPVIPRVSSLPRRARWGIDRIMPPARPEQTVGDAHKQLWHELASGPTECPVCQRPVSIRSQSVGPSMAEFLVRLVGAQLDDPGPKTLREILPHKNVSSRNAKRSTDATYLKHWGLLVQPKAGLFSATRDGLAFVMGHLDVPRGVELYCSRSVLSWSDDMISIREALGRRAAKLDRLYERISDGH